MTEEYIPKFDSPYPGHHGPITGFQFRSPLHLMRSISAVRGRKGRDAEYIVAKPYRVRFWMDRKWWEITVPAGMLTDLASVPWWARRLVGRVGPHLEAAVVHDWLYIAWQDNQIYLGDDPRNQHVARCRDQAFADAVFLAGMKAAKVARWRQIGIYRAVRLGGWPTYRERETGPRYVKVEES